MTYIKLVGELFRARDIIHLEHLYAKRWGAHIVLDALYDQILDKADTIAELALSRKDCKFKINSIPESVDTVEYLEGTLVPLLDEAKEETDDKGYNDISATIDEVKRDVQSALYKLKKLVINKKDDSPVDFKRKGGVFYSDPKDGKTSNKITRR